MSDIDEARRPVPPDLDPGWKPRYIRPISDFIRPMKRGGQPRLGASVCDAERNRRYRAKKKAKAK